MEENILIFWKNFIKTLEHFSTHTLHIAPLSFLTICAFILSLLLSFCCCIPLLYCCRFCLRKHCRHANGNDNRKGLFSYMFANLEEFESLTPLIVTPASSTSSLKQAIKAASNPNLKNVQNHVKSSSIPMKSAFKPTKQQLIMAATASVSDSPPPPRRPNSGKTMIVPLTAANNRNLRLTQHPIPAGTPDSRITSIEAGTTKSFATIPEDDEFSVESENDRTNEIDLVSIDRTYASTRLPCPATHAPPMTGIHQFNSYVPIPVTMPFKEKAPLYEPPAPPWEPSAPIPQRRANLRLNSLQNANNNNNNNSFLNRKYDLMDHDSPGLSSPDNSSCGLGSPVETAGSLSDSFIMPSEGDNRSFSGNGVCYNFETGEQKIIGENSSSNSDGQSTKKYQLHRIEEESENVEDLHKEAPIVASGYSGGQNRALPRSISQQLEFMKK